MKVVRKKVQYTQSNNRDGGKWKLESICFSALSFTVLYTYFHVTHKAFIEKISLSQRCKALADIWESLGKKKKMK